MLHVIGDLVRNELIGSSVPDMPPNFEIDLIDGGAVTLSSSWKSVAPDGQIGDATRGSAESGARFFDDIVSAVSGVLRVFHDMDSSGGPPKK